MMHWAKEMGQGWAWAPYFGKRMALCKIICPSYYKLLQHSLKMAMPPKCLIQGTWTLEASCGLTYLSISLSGQPFTSRVSYLYSSCSLARSAAQIAPHHVWPWWGCVLVSQGSPLPRSGVPPLLELFSPEILGNTNMQMLWPLMHWSMSCPTSPKSGQSGGFAPIN